MLALPKVNMSCLHLFFFLVESPVYMTQLFHEITHAVKLGTVFIQQTFS